VSSEKLKLKGFCIELLKFINQTEPEEISYINDMIKIAETINSKADINSMISDLLEMSEDFKGAKLDSLNEILRSKDLPTLTFMRAKKSRLVLSILNRGAIKTDDEFRLLNSFIDEAINNNSDPQVIESVNELLAAYEFDQ
jgi:hypothetical protein